MEEQQALVQLTRGGNPGARKVKRAQILLAADKGVTDDEIATTVSVGVATVYRIKRRYVEGGLDYALNEFHYTPKHASWLNMVEIEIGVLGSQCLDRRIADKQTLATEVAAWEKNRNEKRATIKWLFTVEKARKKMGAAYPSNSL